MRKNSGRRSFTEKLRDRIKHRLEGDRWKILVRQRKLIDEYSNLIEELRACDQQFMRLNDELPEPNICPACYFNQGAETELKSVENDDRTREGILQCPSCELIVLPG